MAKLEEKHYEYLKNIDFLKEYLEILNSRLIYTNNTIEDDNGPVEELYDANHVLVLKDNFTAFKILLEKLNSDKEELLSQDLIKRVCNIINRHAMYISDDYRKIDNGVKFDDKYPIAHVEDLEDDMNKLLENYYGAWKDLDVFEREARFNIEFLRIHPFEDGNGRTSRLILNYNLLRQGHAPAIIPKKIRKEYFDARNKQDVKWVRDLFEKESEKELSVLDLLIEEYEMDKSKLEYR